MSQRHGEGDLRQRWPAVTSASDRLVALRQREYHNLESNAQRIVKEAIRVAEEAHRSDGNEVNPGVSWASLSLAYPYQSPHNVQEGQLWQRRPDFTSPCNELTSLLRAREHHNLEMEAALSRHVARDPLYDNAHSRLESRNPEIADSSASTTRVATILTPRRPAPLNQRPNLSLTGYDEQEPVEQIVQEVLQLRRTNEQELRSHCHALIDTLRFQVRQSDGIERSLGHLYNRPTSDVVLTQAAARYDQQRQVSALRGTQDPLRMPSHGHSSAFATLCHPIQREQETFSTAMKRMTAEEECRKRAPEAGNLMQRSPTSSFVATSISTSSRGNHHSHPSLQRSAESTLSDIQRSCVSPSAAAGSSLSSNVAQIATVPPCEDGNILYHVCIDFLFKLPHALCL